MLSATEKAYIGLLLSAIAAFGAISYANLTTWPKLWYDEGLAVEVARTLAERQTLNIMVAPQEYAPYAVVLAGSNGYPVTAPLALVFSALGFSFSAARLYMLLWSIACVGIIFFFVRRFFGTQSAVLGGLLVLSFASFFANGRTVTGEIPGFSFLLIGVWLLLKDRVFSAGLLLGLAAAAKPSLYLLAFIPAAVDVIWFGKEKRLQNLLRLGAGYAMPLLAWFALTIPRPLTLGTFSSLAGFYRNPFDSTSVLGNILANLAQVPVQSTTAYFLLLAGIAAAGLYFTREDNVLRRRIFLFFAIVCAISFLYFLRSPGWMRYLLPLELVILMLIPVFLRRLSAQFFGRTAYATLGILALAGVQAYQLFFYSQVYRSDTTLRTASYLNANLGAEKVGIINDAALAALIPAGSKYHFLSITGVPPHGVNALALPPGELPKFIALDENNLPLVQAYAPVLGAYYRPLPLEGGGALFERVREEQP